MGGGIDLSGKIALVSGGSRGIGEAIARGLAGAGAEVLVASRKLESCEAVCESIRAAGGSAEARQCHAGREEDIEALFEDITDRYGRLDILINNAATNPHYGPTDQISAAAYDKTFEVNLRGPFFMSSRAIALMREHGGGSIVSVASIASLVPPPMQGVYAMTKAALVSMTRSFAKENAAYNIRVNAILPGFVDTRFTGVLKQDERTLNTLLGLIPMRRMGEPAEMVGGVLYLVSDAASYTTGASLVMDGGLLA